MNHVLSNRGACLQEIRELVGDDAWLARYALLSALQRSDLRAVNEVLDELLAAVDGPRYSDRGLLARLREERWG